MNEPKPPVNCGFRPAGMSDSEDSDDDYGMPVGGRKFVPAIVRMHNAQVGFWLLFSEKNLFILTHYDNISLHN